VMVGWPARRALVGRSAKDRGWAPDRGAGSRSSMSLNRPLLFAYGAWYSPTA
jgi:hypothetical protein